MCGKLNLPMFLFNVRLFTLMNMDSLIFLQQKELGKSPEKQEKDLLQAWVKSINSILGDNAKQMRRKKVKASVLSLKFNNEEMPGIYRQGK